MERLIHFAVEKIQHYPRGLPGHKGLDELKAASLVRIDFIPVRNEDSRPMWELAMTDSFERDQKHYRKKRPRELAAVLVNLQRYLALLKQSPNAKAVVPAGFLHAEPAGVVAIDQRGGGPGLQETRLYTFPEDKTQSLWLITIGNKAEQSDDIQFCRKFVASLIENQDEPPAP